MTLILEYVAQTTVPVEVDGLIPSNLRDKTLREIERIPVAVGNQKPPLAELFQVSGDPADERIVMQGDLSGVHWIGAGMDRGEIRVFGPAGRHLGSEMTGGEIVVEGDAGDWLGAQMRGGLIRVRGNAGHLAGAAYRGSPRGMTGGTILVHGRAGNEIGHGMRRGLVAVGGAGDAVGFNMLAGTILAFGPCGIRPGAGMRRGTLGLFADERPTLLPTFRPACRLKPLFLTMLLRELDRLDYPFPDLLRNAELDLFHGDFVALGRGEVLVRAS
jgi:formylmethanofuran dehydrogenase subunit C